MSLFALFLVLYACSSCQDELIEYQQNDIKVEIEAGGQWQHDFSLFLGIKKKNSPQIAIWVEDLEGRYLSTIYVTDRIATQSWMAAGGNRRKEALPHWCYSRGVQYSDGLYLPTKKEPLTDGISGATPTGSFDVKVTPLRESGPFVVKVELNHSTDFNDFYPKSASEGDANYSGGKMGSGQPALVFAATVDLASGRKTFRADLVGHSSPDGTDGNIRTDLSGLTTALDIVKQITVSIQ